MRYISLRSENLSEQSPRGDEEGEAEVPKKKKGAKAAPYYDLMDPKRINWVIQEFVMALVWGFGAPLTVPARAKYSVFIHDTIKKLFSSQSCSFEFKRRIDQS